VTVDWRWLGAIAHGDAVALMESTRERILAGDDHAQVILLAEHFPIITLGRSASPGHVIAAPAALAAAGVDVAATTRGGDVTYHGPGQLMIYPVVRVRSGVVSFLETTASVLAEVVADFGIPGAGFRRDPAGLWLDSAKLAACGLHLRRRVAIHGWALNVATPPAMWNLIIPCGLATPIISLDEARAARGIPPAPSVAEVARAVGPRLAALFDATARGITPLR
jgi:lipoyl(octanoyl) transferase